MKKSKNTMELEKVLILKPILYKIFDGSLFKITFKWAFRVTAAFMVIGILWVSWKLWGQLGSNAPAEYFIGGLIMEIFILIAGFIIFNILWIRSNMIDDLPAAKDYPVTPIIVICMKSTGEIFAVIYIILGLALGLASFVAGGNMRNFIPIPIPDMLNFSSSGFIVIVLGAVLGFVTIFSSYFLAEITGALVDIARNTQKKN